MAVQNTIADRYLNSVHSVPSLVYEVVTDDPRISAERVAAFYGRPTATYLDFAEAFVACWLHFSGKEQQIAFLDRLAELGVISGRDAMVLARPNGMVSMIKKIGENVHWLRHAEVLPFLVPEPSKLYQIVLLREILNGDVDLIVSKLRTLEPGYTRDEIIALRPLASTFGPTKRRTLVGVSSGSDEPGKSYDNHGSDTPITTLGRALSAGANGNTVTRSPEIAARTFDLIAVRCDSRDLRRLRTDFANANELDRLLPRPPLASLSAVVVFARVTDISVIENRLLPHLGFSRIDHVFAVGSPTGPDLADQQIALVSIRGLPCTLPREVLSTESSPLEMATRLFTKTKSKAQIFGDPASGWTSFGWSEEEA